MNALKTKLLTLLVIASGIVTAQKDGYNIKIKLRGLQKDSACYLANYYGDKQYIQDTAKANANGEVVFVGDKKLPGGIYLMVFPKKKYFDFLIDQEQNFSMETDTSDIVKFMKVKGSNDNKLFYEYLAFIGEKQKEIEPLRKQLSAVKSSKDSTKVLQEKMSKIDKEVKEYKISFAKKNPKSLQAAIFNGMQDPEVPEAPKLPNGRIDSLFAFHYTRAHFFDSYNFADERLLRTPILYNKMKNYLDNLTYQIPDSINKAADFIVEKAKANKEVFKYVVYYITYTYETSQIMGFDAVFVHMAEQYYLTKQAFWIDSTQLAKITDRAKTLKPLLLGKYTPNLTLKDSTMKDVTLYDVKAKFTILYFWDYDCGHCKKSTPKLQELYLKMKSRGVEVYAVGTEPNVEPWKKFIRENKLTFINVYDPYYSTGFKKTYDIYSTPVVYLLDENKKILAKRLDVEQLDGFLERLLNQKAIDKSGQK